MSVRVLSEVFRGSRAELGARLVLLAIADVANDDGVAWPQQVDPGRPRYSLAHKTRLTDRQIRNCLRELEDLGELEVRKAQRGRARINVYRVTVGALADEDVDYDRLPFRLTQPFTTGKDFRSSGGDDRKSATGTTGNPFPVASKETSEETSERLSETNVSSSPAPPAPRARRRDPLWDAVARSVYGTLDLSRALGKETGVATADLRAQGVGPDELPAIVAAYRRRFRDAAISASAVAKWAPVLRRASGASREAQADRARRFVRSVGHELPERALVEELERFRLTADELSDLLELAATLRRQAA